MLLKNRWPVDVINVGSLNQKVTFWGSRCGTVEMNPTSVHENAGSIPGFAQWALPWPWCRLADPIQPLAWEPPYAAGVALKMKKKKLHHSFILDNILLFHRCHSDVLRLNDIFIQIS